MATAPAPILELATLRTTVPRDEVLQLQQPAIASLFANAKGVRKLQWGFNIEDPSLLHWFVGTTTTTPFHLTTVLTQRQ
jgi:hypothetical protein